jgi:transcriptional regulator with XRE-family HTH domain
MVRGRKNASPPEERSENDVDVNAVVSYNLKLIREREGWTQQGVAQRLAQLTGHELPQASISAMERGFDGDRRRRFDAHELYLLSVVFDVPIAYFFLPPPAGERGQQLLADTQSPISELYVSLLGRENQLEAMDQRLADIGLDNPDHADQALAAVFGADGAAHNWHPHFRTWRKRRLLALERTYGDQLDEVAEFLATFAAELKAVGPKAYLQSKSHRKGEDLLPHDATPEQE